MLEKEVTWDSYEYMGFENTTSFQPRVVERLRENLADSTRKLFKNLYQDLLDGPVACHVLVQNSRFLKYFSFKLAKFSRNCSTLDSSTSRRVRQLEPSTT